MATNKRYQALVQERADLIAEQKKIFAGEAALTDEQKKRDDDIAARLGVLADDLAREERRRQNERALEEGVVTLPGDHITGEADDPKPFKSVGDQMMAIIKSTLHPREPDPRIAKYDAMRAAQIVAATGMYEGGLAEGGAFLQTDFSNTLIERAYEQGQILQRLPVQPVSANANAYSALLIKETSRATGSRYGGVRVYRVGEGATITSSRPEFDRKEVRPWKIAGLCYLTDELVQDITALDGHVRRLFPLEAAFVMQEELFNGTGAGQSTGILNAAATVSVSKESGQAAATLLAKNLSKMYARLWVGSRANAIWMYNQDCEDALDGLFIPVGVGGITPQNIITYDFNTGAKRIKGLPAIPVENCSTLGTVGDIVLADWSQYLAVTKGDLRTDASIHVAFTTDEMALRFVWRWAAEPMWRSAVTPLHGSNTVSPFVTLATRS